MWQTLWNLQNDFSSHQQRSMAEFHSCGKIYNTTSPSKSWPVAMWLAAIPAHHAIPPLPPRPARYWENKKQTQISLGTSHMLLLRATPLAQHPNRKKKQASLLFCHALGQRTTSSSGFLVLHSLFFRIRVSCASAATDGTERTDGSDERTDGRQMSGWLKKCSSAAAGRRVGWYWHWYWVRKICCCRRAKVEANWYHHQHQRRVPVCVCVWSSG